MTTIKQTSRKVIIKTINIAIIVAYLLTRLRKEALGIKTALNEICWNEDDGCYYNVDRDSREQYKRVGYSTFVPLFYRMAPEDRGRRLISRYMLDEKHMKAPHGFRSLSASDVDYNKSITIIRTSLCPSPTGRDRYGHHQPLAPSNFKYRNPDGSIQGFVSWNFCMENILEGLLQGKWMLPILTACNFPENKKTISKPPQCP